MWAAAFDTVRFDEAVLWFSRRVPITAEEFARNAEQARRQAFWIAGVTQADVIRDVHESLKKALADGVPFETWKREIGPKLSKAWLGQGINEPARTETIFRNWTQAAYARARWDQMHEPSVLRFRPYLLFDGVEDSRQSKICEACNGTLLPADHPWWDAHRPPLHHRCRSGIRSLRTEQAKARGITQNPTDVGPQEGFGDGGEWKGPNRAKYLKGAKPPPKPVDVKPTPPPPEPTLEIGKHAKYWQQAPFEFTTTQPKFTASQLDTLRGLNADDLAFLERHPLSTLVLPDRVTSIKGGEATDFAGLYYPKLGRLEVATKPDPDWSGNKFLPGRMHTIGSVAATPREAAQRTIVHEFAHHVEATHGAAAYSRVNVAYQRAFERQRFFTRYAGTDAREYFAESFSAYRHYPIEFKAFDPDGFAMVEEVLGLEAVSP